MFPGNCDRVPLRDPTCHMRTQPWQKGEGGHNTRNGEVEGESRKVKGKEVKVESKSLEEELRHV